MNPFRSACLILLLLACVPCVAQETPTLYVIGDSTAATYPAERAPLTGWAQVFQDYFDPARLVVANKAISGRSSKSFLEEGAWKSVTDVLKPGDVVFIQFGHNDAKKDDAKRYTEPETTYKAFLATYIAETRAKGATPVLVTPIYRNEWEGETLRDTHGDYPPAMRELAQAEGVTLLDLHKRTGERFQALGPDASRTLFMYLEKGESPNYPDGKDDGTHLRDAGARDVCALMVQAIRDSDLLLKDALKDPQPSGVSP